MRNRLLLSLLFNLTTTLFPTSTQAQDQEKIMILGFDHLNQLSNQTPESDVFSRKKQAEIQQLTEHLKGFAPDMILVEVDSKEQRQLDSLYALYKSGKLHFTDLPDGKSETYQVGFRLARELNHASIYGADHYQATFQSLLSKCKNIEVFQNELKKLHTTVRPLKKLVQQDSLSIHDYIVQMNKPEMIHLTHNLFYNLPALVVNGDFSASGTNTVDLGRLDKDYIVAEFITLFYNRNLKIYSNILNAQRKTDHKKLLVIMGQTHVGVLQDIFDTNPDFIIVSPLDYLRGVK